MHITNGCFLTAAAVALSFANAAALDIQGHVLDSAAHAPIAGAVVALESDSTVNVLTDSAGQFHLVHVATRVRPGTRNTGDGTTRRPADVTLATLQGRLLPHAGLPQTAQLPSGVYLRVTHGNRGRTVVVPAGGSMTDVAVRAGGAQVTPATKAAAAALRVSHDGYYPAVYTPLADTETGVVIELQVLVDSSECLAQGADLVLDGSHTSQYTGAPDNGSVVDARTASWSFENGWLATPRTSTDVCWVGGEIFLTYNDSVLTPTDAWADIWHHNGGWTLKYDNANWVFDRVTVRHVGDGFNISTGAQNFTIRNSHIADIRDDAVQNDQFHSGTITDNFIDGCYVAFSCREDIDPVDGGHNTMTVSDNLVWVKPMYSVFKGDSPGNGQIIKWQTDAPELAPHLVFTSNIVRVGQVPFQGSSSPAEFYFPPDCEFSDNVLVWDGDDPVPDELVAWFSAARNSRIGTMAEWDAAVARWWAAHPDVK